MKGLDVSNSFTPRFAPRSFLPETIIYIPVTRRSIAFLVRSHNSHPSVHDHGALHNLPLCIPDSHISRTPSPHRCSVFQLVIRLHTTPKSVSIHVNSANPRLSRSSYTTGPWQRRLPPAAAPPRKLSNAFSLLQHNHGTSPTPLTF